MTTTTRNEAAERLRDLISRSAWPWRGIAAHHSSLLDEALAAERRAAVSEFYDRLEAIGFAGAKLIREAMLNDRP